MNLGAWPSPRAADFFLGARVTPESEVRKEREMASMSLRTTLGTAEFSLLEKTRGARYVVMADEWKDNLKKKTMSIVPQQFVNTRQNSR